MTDVPGDMTKNGTVAYAWYWQLRTIAQEVRAVTLKTGLKQWAILKSLIVEVQSTNYWEDDSEDVEAFVRDAMQVTRGEENGVVRVRMLPRRCESALSR